MAAVALPRASNTVMLSLLFIGLSSLIYTYKTEGHSKRERMEIIGPQLKRVFAG